MSTLNLDSLYSEALNKVKNNFPETTAQQRLQTIQHQYLSTIVFAKTLDSRQYRRYLRIPGYYDPNSHTVFLNKPLIEKLPHETAFLVCYHELVHALSHHENYWQDNEHIFISGIKIERFSHNEYQCYNRLLNEGLVQYFTIVHNGVKDTSYAYKKEVLLVRHLVDYLGVNAMRTSLLSGTTHHLEALFNDVFGLSTFSVFNQLIDQNHYQKAALLLSPSLVQEPVFAPFPLVSTAPQSKTVAP